MILSTILLLLQLSVSLLTNALANPAITEEQKTRAISFAEQAIVLSASYLESQWGSGEMVNASVLNTSGAIPTGSTPISPTSTNCSIAPDGRSKLNDEDRQKILDSKYFAGNEQGAREVVDKWNSVTMYNWFSSTIGWCEKELWEK